MLQKLAQTNRLCYKRKTQNKSILQKKIYTETIGTVTNRAYQGRGVPTRGGGCLQGRGRTELHCMLQKLAQTNRLCYKRKTQNNSILLKKIYTETIGTVTNRAYQGRGVPTRGGGYSARLQTVPTGEGAHRASL